MISTPRGRLLMVDDDPEDILLVKLAINRASLPLDVDSLPDGSVLIPHLEAMGDLKNENTTTPELIIFLDLNMPLRDGRSCLLDLKSDDRFSSIPVVVFSTSESPDDIQLSYRLKANSYICKPGDIMQLEDMLRTVYEYWFKSVE